MRIAAVTMAYNEPDFVPVWLRHYAAQVGAEHCHIIDHGSDDGSTDGLGKVSVVRLPRTPQDDPRRANFISEYCSALLRWYHWVIYSDIDELLVADPRYFRSLRRLCAAAPAPVMTAVGLDVQHLPTDGEPPIDPTRLVSLQRHWTVMTTSMCKPLIISRRVRWTPGFHTCDAPVEFAPLMLFHLRHYDLDQGLRRMAKTRTMPWRYDYAGSHQKLSDEQVRKGRINAARHPRKDCPLDISEPPLSTLLPELVGQQEPRIRDKELYKINIDMVVQELWRIPERFVGTF